jgi:hypothetical protein
MGNGRGWRERERLITDRERIGRMSELSGKECRGNWRDRLRRGRDRW